jgi:Leucine-rich repeat (LRR) protein
VRLSTITELSLIGLKWDTLDGLERYTSLETLYLKNAQIGSIDALESIHTLRTISANGEIYERIMTMFENAGVTVIFQE